MAGLGETFDPEGVEPRDNFDPLPIDIEYVMEAVESNVVDITNGKRANFTFKVTEGDFEGRQHWDGCNYLHSSETAQRIGQQWLAELCSACGHRGPLDDTEVLHGIPIRVKLKKSMKKDPDDPSGKKKIANLDMNGNHRNEIARFRPYDAASAPERTPTPRQQSKPTQAAGASAKSDRPWGKKSA